MDKIDKATKIQELEERIKRYEEKRHRLLTEEDKAAGSRLGNEDVLRQISVYEELIRMAKSEVIRLRTESN